MDANKYNFYKQEVDELKVKEASPLGNITVKDIDGVDHQVADYLKGKKAALFVNTASECGFTDSNYRGLVDLYNKYKDQGLEILGFPCNQFMNQEKACELDIKNHVKGKFNVNFPLFSKIDVNGENSHELYNNLKLASKDLNLGDGKVKNIPWNFSKFLVDGNGNVVSFYPSNVNPADLANDVEKLL